MRSSFFLYAISLFFSLNCFAVSSFYGGALDKKTPTMFVQPEFLFNTHESGLADSNATGAGIRYTLGAYAGDFRPLGVFLKISDNKIDFSHTDSSSHSATYDLYTQFRFMWFYSSFVLSLHELKIKNENVKTLDLYGTGLGGSLGFYYPLLDQFVLHADYTYIMLRNTYDKTGKDVDFNGRSEIEIGGYYNLVKDTLDISFGYTNRYYKLNVSDKNYVENISAPFVGLRLGTIF